MVEKTDGPRQNWVAFGQAECGNQDLEKDLQVLVRLCMIKDERFNHLLGGASRQVVEQV